MSWRRKEPGYQQPWYWLCWTRIIRSLHVNALRPRQNGRHFADDIFKRIFLNENVWISIQISLKFVPKGSINKIPALFQVMAWRRSGDKPLFEPMMVSLLTHICVTRSQWVKFRHRRFAISVPRHYLNQWSLVVNWTLGERQRNLNQNAIITSTKFESKYNHYHSQKCLKMSSAAWAAFHLVLNAFCPLGPRNTDTDWQNVDKHASLDW